MKRFLTSLLIFSPLMFWALVYSPLTYSQEEAQVILRSTVKGNQEQPNVLYIVPWQQGETLQPVYQPMQTLVDGVFEQVDREEFLRELDYRRKIDTNTIDSQP